MNGKNDKKPIASSFIASSGKMQFNKRDRTE